MKDVAIRIRGLTKTFQIPHEKRSTLAQSVIGTIMRGKVRYESLRALNNISLEVKEGESIGIMGPNGSGKSTLLKIIAKILQPDKGTIEVNGKIVPLLELGLGFVQELTAKENIFLYGSLLGLTKKQVNEKYEAIIAFSGLATFVDTPVKDFSSGMIARLAFSIAKEAKGDIYLVDEVLAVGDETFQKKCVIEFERLKKNGKTIVFVSHSESLVSKICERIAILENGEISRIGKTSSILKLKATSSEKIEQARQLEAESKLRSNETRLTKDIKSLNSRIEGLQTENQALKAKMDDANGQLAEKTGLKIQMSTILAEQKGALACIKEKDALIGSLKKTINTANCMISTVTENTRELISSKAKSSQEQKKLLKDASATTGLSLSPPDYISIGISGKCNLSCNICPTWKIKPKRESIDIETLKKSMKEILQSFPNTRVYFSGFEPLTQKDLLIQALNLGKGKLEMGIYTNGVLLDDATSKEILTAGASHVIVSLDSTNPKVHNEFRNSKDAFQKALSGIKSLVKHAEKINPQAKIEIMFLITGKNLAEITKSHTLAKELGVYCINYQPYRHMSEGKREESGYWVGKDDLPELQREIKKLVALRRKQAIPHVGNTEAELNSIVRYFKGEHNLKGQNGEADAYVETFHITEEGKVDFEGRGPWLSIWDKTLKEIWESPEFWEVRQKIYYRLGENSRK